MTKIMPSLQNLIKLSYDAPAFGWAFLYGAKSIPVGAAGRGRTGTMLPPADFESAASANSATAACVTVLL